MAQLDYLRNSLLSAKARSENEGKHTRYEMGCQLLLAKSLCPHGEWLTFLEEADISKDEASELMRWSSYWQISENSEVFQLKPSDTKGSAEQISEIFEISLPTEHAKREFMRAEPEVKEIIKEVIREDPEAEVKAAEIKRLRAELSSSKSKADDLQRRLNLTEENNIREVILNAQVKSGVLEMISDFACGLADEYYLNAPSAEKARFLQSVVDLANRCNAFVECNSPKSINTQIIDV